jgi:peptidoglycan hydrolase CwlO-like protein
VHGDKSVVELLRAELAELDEGVAQLNRVQDELNAQRKKLNAERDDILNRITELTVSDEVDANQGYFAAQQRLREQKAEQVKAWKESGLTLKQIQAVIPQKSPIDRALAGARKG